MPGELTTFPVATKTLTEAKSELLIALELENLDNTSDAAKPVSTLTQTALDLKAPLAAPALTGNATAVNLTISGTFSAKIGSASGLPIKTGTAGVIEAGAFGTTSGTFCQGNDSRVVGAIQSNTTQAGGGDAILNMVTILEADYNAIITPDPDTVYIITEP
jgi:hypothetical protein